MFPYVCLATMPLFCRMDWPRRLGVYFSWKQSNSPINRDSSDIDSAKENDNEIESLKTDYSALSPDETLHDEALRKSK